MPECKCGQIPANVKIIKVGPSEVGIPDLNRIVRDVYFKRLSDEARIKEELLNRVREIIIIPEERRNLYAEALFQEYLRFAERVGKRMAGQQSPSGGTFKLEKSQKSGKSELKKKFNLFRWLKMTRGK